MNALQQWLQGRKTYLTCLAAGVLLFGSWQKWWQLPPEIYAALAAVATAFLRAGVAKLQLPPPALEPTPPPAAPPAPAAPPPTPPLPPAPRAALPILTTTALLAASLLLPGCASLDPAGVYHGDKLLYDADLALAASYDTLHAFVLWERDNRPALSSVPAIRAAADQVRAAAPQWFASAFALRDACQANPSSANQSALAAALAVIQQAALQAANFMTTNAALAHPQSPPAPAPPANAPKPIPST